MLKNKLYVNGQKVYELVENKLTYYFKNSRVKAEGTYKSGLIEGHRATHFLLKTQVPAELYLS